MNEILEQLKTYQEEVETFASGTPEEVEDFRIRFLGTKGLIKSLFSEIKNIPKGERKEFGQKLNAFKAATEKKYKEAREKLTTEETGEESSDIDLSLPAEPQPLGSRHPIQIIRQEIIRIFGKIGFNIAEGPEMEDDWHNFTALNLPPDHPARDMQDTFYLQRNPDKVLRTHTSPVQVRVMEEGNLPIRIICPGRVFRNETISARAHCFFHQVEGLYIDEEVSFADLKQTLYYFVKEMFGSDTGIRFRPSYFPFTEPSAEMDISCLICGGEGCSVCKHTGWVEILGCGMVHPNVLKNCDIDPEKYTGFAFGMGIERIAMLKYQIDDLRVFSQNDIRFLKQFVGVGQ